jgi:DNA repair protein RadC
MKKYKFPKINVKVSVTKGDRVQITSPDKMVEVMRSIFDADTILWTEEMVMVCLNRANEVIGYYKISSGGFSGTVVDPKVVMTIALQSAASSIILAHNHPSGNLKPSDGDKRITEKLKSACSFLDVSLLDHLIITDSSYFSFQENGYL